MALTQILGERDQLQDNAGRVLAGGTVDIFEPNTTTRVSTFADSALTDTNTNPVVLDGSGRASIWVTRNVDIRISDAAGNLIVEELEVNPDDAGGGAEGGLVFNGSFELDTDADGIPDGWTNDVNDAGSNNGIDETESSAGGRSWRTQSGGSGGGELVTTDFFAVNEVDDLRVDFDLFSTVAAVRNIVRIEWFDVSQVSISSTDVYDSVANPTMFTTQNTLATPPAGARFAKLRIIGGAATGQQSGITYWDNFNVFYPQEAAGSFDNISIVGNTISATNTDGDVNIVPNGNGSVTITRSLELISEDAGNPAVPEPITINLEWQSATPLPYASIGYNASTNLAIINRAHTAQILLQGEDSEGSLQDLFRGDPDDSVRLYHAGNEALLTNGFGITVSDPQSVRNEHGIAFGAESGANLLALMQVQSDGDFVIRNFSTGDDVRIEGTDTSDVQRVMIDCDPDQGVTLFYDGTAGLETQSGGTRIAGNILMQDTIGGTTEVLMQTISSGFAILNQIDGTPTILFTEDSSGNQVQSAYFFPDSNGSQLWHENVRRIVTTSNGGAVRRNLSSDSGLATMRFEHANGTLRGYVGMNAAQLELRSEVNAGIISVEGRNGDGSLRTLLEADGAAGVSLFFEGTEEFRSANSDVVDGVTGAEVRHFDQTFYPIGLGVLPPVSITTARVVTQLDHLKTLFWTGGAAGLAVTLPDSTSLPAGAWGMIINSSVSSKDIDAAVGATINWYDGSGTIQTGNRSLAVGGVATWWVRQDGIYGLWGVGLS